jgi:hypothetical protein
MAYIPENSKWYLATLVEEITVEGETVNVVHKNLVLIRADSPEQSYEKATQLGAESEMNYQNPHGKMVEVRFKGLSDLSVIYEELEDGAELRFEEVIGLPKDDVQALIRRKEDLSVFRPISPTKGPDYSSAEVLDEASKLIGRTNSGTTNSGTTNSGTGNSGTDGLECTPKLRQR